jgi:hypothetical protein
MAQTLLDQKEAGKMLLLITNSDYEYTARMMAFAYDRFLPAGMTWRDLFDMVRRQACRGWAAPRFFVLGMQRECAFACRHWGELQRGCVQCAAVSTTMVNVFEC